MSEKVPRLRADSGSESEPESGEERDEEVTVDSRKSGAASGATAKNPFNPTALEKRRRGNVWTNVVVAEDLTSFLSKVGFFVAPLFF